MQKRKLGKNGPELTAIGLGAWAIGGPWRWGWGPADESESIRTIHRALDLGINWIDTAAAYGLGRSEEIVGKALKDRRQNMFIATKCGLVWDEAGHVRNDISPRSIRREVEASLRRLQTDVIDLYQIHWPHANQSESNAWREMVHLFKEGKIRWLGVSNFSIKQLLRCQAIRHIDALQPPYSLLRRDIEAEILPYCVRSGIGVIAYSPMASGLLTGRFDRVTLAPDDWRCRDRMFKEPLLSRNLAFVEELGKIAAGYGKTAGQLAVAWVLQQPGITAAIVGARRVSQVEENVLADDLTVSPEDMGRIDILLQDHRVRIKSHG